MELEPLSDQAVMARMRDEAEALRLTQGLRQSAASWIVDMVQAYTTVAVFYDTETTIYAEAAERIRVLAAKLAPESLPGRLHVVPCCYEMQLDGERICQRTGLAWDEVVRLHSTTEYTVYAIGFCPGFPYLGYLPSLLSEVPRLDSPRLRVEAGSVGLTGRQTGVYTEARPGGWNIVGRTPLELVNVAEGYFPLQTGDRVRFERIDEAEFARRRGERIGEPGA